MTGGWLLLLLSVALGAPAEVGVQPDLSDPEVRLETQLVVLDGLLDGGMVEQALGMIAEIRKQGGDDVRLDVAQGRAMHLAGMDTDATALLVTTTRKHPRSADAWAQLGILHADTGKVADAVAALKRAARIQPKNADIQNNLGFALLAAGRAEDAIECFRTALSLDPSSVATRNNLGFALVRLDRYDEAIEAFRSAGAEAEARYNFGVACELKGDRAGAITNYQASLAARPGHALATAGLSRVLQEPSP